MRLTRTKVRPAPALVTQAMLAVLFVTTTQVAPALAQGSDRATEAADTVQEREPSIRFGHGSRGFEFGTSDGNYLMQLQLRVQLRYAYPFDSNPITFDDFSDRDQHIFKVNRNGPAGDAA